MPARRDIIIAAVLCALAITEVSLEVAYANPSLSHTPHAARLLAGCAVGTVGLCASVLWWRTRPIAAVAVVVGACLGVVAIGASIDALPNCSLLAVAVVAFGAGDRPDTVRARVGLALLLVGLGCIDVIWDRSNNVVPLLFVAAGPWLCGRVSQSRRAVAQRLDWVAQQMRAEQARYTDAGVLLERRRLARELHDVVGHGMTLVVVQAAAGRHLAMSEPRLARESLDAITAAAQQARTELARLVELLADTDDVAPALAQVPQLVAGAVAGGLGVSVRGLPVSVELSAGVDRAAHRVVQEALTNVLRHAPGAHAELHLAVSDGILSVTVTNTGGRSTDHPSALAGAGSGFGLVGLRERVEACGGTFAAGPTADGWTISAHLPTIAAASAEFTAPIAGGGRR